MHQFLCPLRTTDLTPSDAFIETKKLDGLNTAARSSVRTKELCTSLVSEIRRVLRVGKATLRGRRALVTTHVLLHVYLHAVAGKLDAV